MGLLKEYTYSGGRRRWTSLGVPGTGVGDGKEILFGSVVGNQ